jgi:transcription initiation factor TFIIB
MVTDPE